MDFEVSVRTLVAPALVASDGHRAGSQPGKVTLHMIRRHRT